jgi:hypothetical protein
MIGYPPLPDPCAARRVSAHPLLRLPRQLSSRPQAGALPSTARDGAGRTRGGPITRRDSRSANAVVEAEATATMENSEAAVGVLMTCRSITARTSRRSHGPALTGWTRTTQQTGSVTRAGIKLDDATLIFPVYLSSEARTCLLPRVAKPQSKVGANSTNNLAPQRSVVAARLFGGGVVEL